MHEAATPNDTIAQVLTKRPLAARVLVSRRMHCVGCAIAPFETLGEACAASGIPLDVLLKELNSDELNSDTGDSGDRGPVA